MSIQTDLHRLFPRSPASSSDREPPIVSSEVLTSEVISSAGSRGSVPLSMEVAEAVRAYVNRGRVRLDELVPLIHRDQVLVARLVAATNRVAYQSTSPVRSVSEVVRRLGTRRLLTTIEELGGESSFEKSQERNPSFSYALHRAHVVREVALLLHHSAEVTLDADVLGVVLALWELPLIGLAWKYPALFGLLTMEKARAATAGATGKLRDQVFEARVGLSRPALCLSVLQGLMVPEELKRFLSYCSLGALKGSGPSSPEIIELRLIAGFCLGSSALTDEYLRFSGRSGFEELVREWQTRLSLPGGSIMVLLSKLEAVLQESSPQSGLSAMRIPSSRLFSRISETERELPEDSPQIPSDAELGNDAHLVGTLVREIQREKKAPSLGSETSLGHQIWLTCYGLLHGVKFDRVVVLVVDYTAGEIRPGVIFGKRSEEIDSYRLRVGDTETGKSAELVACREAQPIFGGKPLTPDGGQVCAFPIIDSDGVHAVVYCERAGPAALRPLALDHKMAVTAFAECWRR